MKTQIIIIISKKKKWKFMNTATNTRSVAWFLEIQATISMASYGTKSSIAKENLCIKDISKF